MQQYTENSDRELGHRHHPYRRAKRPPAKRASPSKEELLNKYQKELKDMLNQNPSKRQSYIEPLKNHLFLDWQQDEQVKKRSSSNATAQLKSIENKRVSKFHNQDNQKESSSNYRSQTLRKSDKLIMSRYDTLNDHGIARVNRRYQLTEKRTSQQYSPSSNQPAFVLPSIADRNINIDPTTTELSKQQKLKTQTNDAPTRKIILLTSDQLKGGSYTLTDYRPSRSRSPHKDSESIQHPSHLISNSAVKDYLSEHRSPVKRATQHPNQTFHDSQFTKTQQSMSHHFGKKTVFYKKLFNEKQAAELSSLSKKIKRPIDLPNKDELPKFLNFYQSLDPTFDFKSLLQEPNFGIVRFRDAVYIGQCVAGSEGKQLRHGKGIYITKKFQFQGEFVDNQKKHGTEVTEEGIYKGQFKNGMRNGKGQFRWHNGEYYNGEWENNKKHGSGIWTSSVLGGDNQLPDSYMGEWEKGNVQGYGVHTWNNGKSRYEGEFKNFLKHGSGVEKFENGDRYEGHYQNGKAQGYGQYYWADGSQYKGSFVAGLREGTGVWLESSKDRYEGQLREDCKHGKGKLFYSNGDIFEGMFEMDSRQGPGKLTIASRQQIIKGVWKNNQLQTQ